MDHCAASACLRQQPSGEFKNSFGPGNDRKSNIVMTPTSTKLLETLQSRFAMRGNHSSAQLLCESLVQLRGNDPIAATTIWRIQKSLRGGKLTKIENCHDTKMLTPNEPTPKSTKLTFLSSDRTGTRGEPKHMHSA